MRKILFLLLFFTSAFFGLHAQKGGLPLAEEYFRAGEYAKAKSIYQNFTGDIESSKKVYVNYLECLAKLKEIEETEKFLKKMIKWEPANPIYKIDLAYVYLKNNRNSEAQKIFDKIQKAAKDNPDLITPTASYLVKVGLYDIARQVYIQGRKTLKSDFNFTLELAEIYKIEKNTDAMIIELVRVLLMNQNDKEFLKGKFQEFITTEEEFKKFEETIISRIQEDPTQYLYNDLLIWLYVQQKDFYRAFIQAKAYDRLMKVQGNKLMEVGRIALENKDYESAGEIFEYVAKEYRNGPNYTQARRLKIQAKEEFVKNTFPIDQVKIRSLISDYKGLITELGKNQQTLDAIRNMALLYGFYVDSKDTATMLLDEVIKSPYADPVFIAKSKLDLGDIYVLKNEPWEATLYYSQVEKLQKDQPLGHEAKLRNAKLSYYTGQFELAQEHLDVLKLATHREIANDAVDLSLFILDNIGMDDDSTHAAMQEYSHIELMIFQNKYKEALVRLDTMLNHYKGNTLEDEIFLLQARIYRKLGRYEDAIARLESIGSLFKLDIYGDDAAFMQAQIYEENLHNKEKAMELYNKFLVDFPASIYTAEARKRFRILRGDNLN